MSSHHFVKEGQEPALLIMNGKPCPFELLQQLLEWSPYVIVPGAAIERVKSLGIKIDAVLASREDERQTLELVQEQMPVDILLVPGQPGSHLIAALDMLAAKKFAAVNIVWPEQESHSLLKAISGYADALNIVLVEDHSRTYRLHARFEKWFAKNTRLCLAPVGEVKVSTDGLSGDLKEETIEADRELTVAQDGVVKIEHPDGELFLKESWDQ